MEVLEKLDQMGRAWDEFKSENDRRIKALESKKTVDPLVEEKLTKISDDVLNQVKALETKLNQVSTALNRPGSTGSKVEGADKKAMHDAYAKFLRKGSDKLTADEMKALTDQTDAEGGYMIRPEISNEITQVQEGISAMRQVSNVVQTTSDAIEFIDDSGDFQAAWVGEVDPRPETGTSTLAKTQILVHEIYTKPYVSQKLIDDAVFNVEQYVNNKIASAFASKEDLTFLTGTGTGQPKGVLAYAAGTGAGQIQDIASGSAGALTGDALISLLYALDPADVDQSTVVANPAAVAGTLKLKDGQGQYLWNISALRDGAPVTLLGRPVKLDSNLGGIVTGEYPIIIGNFKRAYTIVDRVGIRLLRDPYTAKPYVQFYATKRVGGGVTATKSIKRLIVA